LLSLTISFDSKFNVAELRITDEKTVFERLSDDDGRAAVVTAEKAIAEREHKKTSDRFLEESPVGMTETDFIQWHRNYQDANHNSEEGSYPVALKTRYRLLRDSHPGKLSYAYLYARMLSPKEGTAEAEQIVSKWPDFGYGLSLLAYDYLMNSPIDVEKVANIANRALAISPDAPIKQDMPQFRRAAKLEPRLKKIALSFDYDSLNKYRNARLDIQKEGVGMFNVFNRRLSPSGWTTSGQFSLSWQYHGLFWDSDFTKISACFELSMKPPHTIKLLFMGMQDPLNNTMYILEDEMKAAGGKRDICYWLDDVAALKEVKVAIINF
jgi:hypothetical protein